jgi:hypothetical protein
MVGDGNLESLQRTGFDDCIREVVQLVLKRDADVDMPRFWRLALGV